LLVLCLATALGIGAWKTHYLDWQTQNDFVTHLNLAISSLLKLIHSGATTGNFMHTAIMAGLCIAGLSFLRVCIKALSLSHDEDLHEAETPSSVAAIVIESKLVQIMSAFLICSYMVVRGIPIEVWILMGMLSWLIVMQLIIAMTMAMQEHSLARLVYGCQCLILVGVGASQSAYLVLHWISSGSFVFGLAGLNMLIIGGFLWWRPIIQIIRRFKGSRETKLFS
jgi:hypothetical protein